jgi:hypothetical protein
MKHKAIKIDWDELESAFDNKNEELVYYLDRVTGQVVLEGEGEDDFDDDEDVIDDASSPDAAGRNDATRIYIEPPDSVELLLWMRDFLRDTEDLESDVRGRLQEAVDLPEPVPAIRHVLDEAAEVRDRWFAYRSDRLHEAMDAWLDTNDVSPVDSPPWK